MASTSWRDHITILPQGAIIQKFQIANQNIVLGFDNPEQYQAEYSPFIGETIGRCANRISNARIDNLNGKSYKLAANNGPNTLHGGQRGWGKRTFQGPRDVTRNGRDAMELTYRSEDGEEGFPGTVELKVWYLGEVADRNGKQQVSLEIEYEATLVGEDIEETVINVCNHSYFNIGGQPTIENTSVTLRTTLHQATDADDIPTGKIEPFSGLTANDEFVLGKHDPDIDHCFIINDKPETVPVDTRLGPLNAFCELHHHNTGIKLEVRSTEPAFQFYTGKYVDVPAMNGKPPLGPRSGICIEASRYVNAINNEKWRTMVVLKRGQVYGSRTIYTATEI